MQRGIESKTSGPPATRACADRVQAHGFPDDVIDVRQAAEVPELQLAGGGAPGGIGRQTVGHQLLVGSLLDVRVRGQLKQDVAQGVAAGLEAGNQEGGQL